MFKGVLPKVALFTYTRPPQHLDQRDRNAGGKIDIKLFGSRPARVLSCDYPQQRKQSLASCLRPRQLCNPTVSSSTVKPAEKRSSPPSASLAEKMDAPVPCAWGSCSAAVLGQQHAELPGPLQGTPLQGKSLAPSEGVSSEHHGMDQNSFV